LINERAFKDDVNRALESQTYESLSVDMLITKIKMQEEVINKFERMGGSATDRSGDRSFRLSTNEIIDDKLRLQEKIRILE
jgi:hypothetical protein